ncbi:MAG: pyruvate carboxyltransferase [Proteobacteria bacterium]|jgi:isopropylmalate/homocitrate/citramalate synthase|nr:pyruvate carboxyltransferase [Pseudomonadota bacterium]
MSDQPWKTDDCFVSPWNFAPEVLENLHFPKQIKIHDVTLRDGEQQTGVAFDKDDKIRIAEGLAEAGVHRIEAGMPVVSPQDAAAITEIVKRDLGPQIFSFSRCMVDDVKRAIDTGVNGVVMEVPSSEHIIKYGYEWPMEKAIDLSIESTAFAHEQGLEVVFFPIDFTRADMTWVLNLISRVADEGHMDSLALVDTFGATSPHAMQYFVRQVKARFPDTPLEAHFHMDFGMGVANTIMALAEGVEVVQSTILGIGERAGNTPWEETVLALLTLYGIDVGVNYDKLYKLALMVSEMANHPIPASRPVVGEHAYNVESGIIATWLLNCGDERVTEVFPYRPSLIGRDDPQVVMGKGSGIDSVKHWLQRANIEASEEQAMEVLGAVKGWGLQYKRLMTQEEFNELAKGVLPDQAA